VRCWIFRLKLDRRLQWSHGIGEVLLSKQRHSQTQIRIAKCRVDLRGLLEVPDGLWQILCLARQLAQHILRACIRRIDLQFLLQLLLRLILKIRSRIRLGKQQPSQTEVNARVTRLLFQNLAVVLLRAIPFALSLTHVCIHLERGNRSWRGLCQLTRSAARKVGIRMRRHIQHFRIMREMLIQDTQQIQKWRLLLQQSSTSHAIQPCTLLQFFVRQVRCCLREQRHGFGAMAALRE
jgi:hypothetical protein